MKGFLLLQLLLISGINSGIIAQNALPNIVIIYADDMGYGDLTCQNQQSKIPTPNLDLLAEQGLRFTDAHSSSGICSPSRYALLTGQYHWRRMHDIVRVFEPSVFKVNEFTLPGMLQEKGYNTACIGKWHLGWNWHAIANVEQLKKPFLPKHFNWTKPIPDGPTDHGFDYYFGDGTVNFPPYTFIENNKVLQIPTQSMTVGNQKTKEGEWEFRDGPMVEDWDAYQVLPTITDKALDYISNQEAKAPFFLYFPLSCPHAPIIPNQEFTGKSEAGGYGDFVVQTDWIVGQIMQLLEEKQITNNTILIFTSDNGPEKYAYPRVTNYNHKSMGPLRGLKRDIWEGGHRVPFIIRWPGKIASGFVSNETVHQVDILATLANVVDYPLSNEVAVDSYNLLSLITGKKYTSPLREATVHNTYKDRWAIRVGDWLLIDGYSGTYTPVPEWYQQQNNYTEYEKDNPGLLYNLANDLSQKHDLYDQNPEKVAAMLKLLHQYQEAGRSVNRRIN